ncbi:ribonuclease D, partial [Mycobacterium eburneum]
MCSDICEATREHLDRTEPEPTPLPHPADGVPELSVTVGEIAAAAARLGGGRGPVAVGAARAGGFREENP